MAALSLPQLDAAMTAGATLAHAFRWGAMPPSPAAAIDLPPAIEGPLGALAARLDVPARGSIFHLILNDWRAPGVAGGGLRA